MEGRAQVRTGRFRRDPVAGRTVWVITASRHGSAREVGAAIARKLNERGQRARTLDAADATVAPPAGDPVVLGSAVYMGRWMKPARELARRLAAEEGERPVWLFSVGPLGQPPEPPEPVPAEALGELGGDRARGYRVFSGRLDRTQLSRRERLIVNAVRAPDGDYRDWDAVAGWAAGVSAELHVPIAGAAPRDLRLAAAGHAG